MRVLVTGLPNAPHADAGKVLDLPDAEAQDMIRRGTATAASDNPPAELPGEPEPEPEPEPELATTRKTAAKPRATKKK